MDTSSKSSPGASAIQKLERFYMELSGDEQKVISEMVRASLVHAADSYEGGQDSKEAAASGSSIPQYVNGLTGQNAPKLISALAFPGRLVAHSIPGCNASALVAIKDGSA